VWTDRQSWSLDFDSSLAENLQIIGKSPSGSISSSPHRLIFDLNRSAQKRKAKTRDEKENAKEKSN
jgi:hypothetical protein